MACPAGGLPEKRLNPDIGANVLIEIGTRGEPCALFKRAAESASRGIADVQSNGIHGQTIDDELLSLRRARLHAPFLESLASFCHKCALDSPW